MNRTEAVRARRKLTKVQGFKVSKCGTSGLTEFGQAGALARPNAHRAGRPSTALRRPRRGGSKPWLNRSAGHPALRPASGWVTGRAMPVLPCPTATPRRGQLPNLPHPTSCPREVGK